MTIRTDNLHTKNVRSQSIIISPDDNRPVKPGYLRTIVEVGDIVSHTYKIWADEEENEITDFYLVSRQHECGVWFQLDEILSEPNLKVAGTLHL